MKYLLMIILLFLPFELFGLDFKSIHATYDVSYGVIGQVGHADAMIDIESGTYKIQIKAEGKGIVKFFSRGRKEVYESTGIIKDGRLLPSLFVKNKSWGSKEERKRYFFNHDKGEVVVVKTSVNGGKVTESKSLLPYYAKDDILTLFFNLKMLIGEALQPEKSVLLHAVGANRQDGSLSVKVPKGKIKEEIATLLGFENDLLIVILNQKIFSSKQGELFMHITKEGICDRVMLKDVVLYGDLMGKIKNLKIEK
jgi:hypothetical protein